ncbi:primase-helicase zinc-binding domain-containing protein [Ferrimonas sediminicola]
MIFDRLGIKVPKRGKHGPCPLCGDGVDRFHFDDKEGRGTWHCRKCADKSAGDGLSMVSRYFDVSCYHAVRLVVSTLGRHGK